MLMAAEAASLCGALERSSGRVNIRNGYRERVWETRVGTIELAILDSGKGATSGLALAAAPAGGEAFVSMIADAYSAGVSS